MTKLRTALAASLLCAALLASAFVAAERAGAGGMTTATTSAPAARPLQRDSVHLALGNPSGATGSTANANNFLVVRPQFALSYNRDKGGPNWVSWHTDRSDLGSVDRTNAFAPDPLLPAAWRIRPTDYAGSGFDRGHVCPSADRTRTEADNRATFVMSNMLPQTADLNREVWRKLEEYSRTLVNQGNEVYVVAGGRGEARTIAGGRVNVPTHTWKIITVLPAGNNDLRRVSANTRVIAVDMPNVDGIRADPWQKYITTVDEIESATGYDFLSNVSEDVQAVVEARRDSGRAPAGGRGRRRRGRRAPR